MACGGGCPALEECIVDVSWDSGTSPDGKCFCLTDFGWVGPECTQLGPTAILYAVVSSLIVVALLLMLFSAAVDVWRVIVNARLRQMGTLMVTMLYVVVAGIAVLAHRVLEIATLFTPKDIVEVEDYKGDLYKTHKLYNLQFFSPLVILSFVVGILALFRVGVLWLQVADSAIHLHEAQQRIRMFTYITRTCEVVFVLTYIVVYLVGGFDRYYVGFWISLPFFLGVFLLSFWARVKIVSLLSTAARLERQQLSLGLNSSANDAPQRSSSGISFWLRGSNLPQKDRLPTEKTLVLIVRYSNAIMVICLLYICFGIPYALFYTWGKEEYSPYNRIGALPVFWTILNILGTLTVIIVQRVTHSSIQNKLKHVSKKEERGNGVELMEETVSSALGDSEDKFNSGDMVAI